jgi:hypothetical protein
MRQLEEGRQRLEHVEAHLNIKGDAGGRHAHAAPTQQVRYSSDTSPDSHSIREAIASHLLETAGRRRI